MPSKSRFNFKQESRVAPAANHVIVPITMNTEEMTLSTLLKNYISIIGYTEQLMKEDNANILIDENKSMLNKIECLIDKLDRSGQNTPNFSAKIDCSFHNEIKNLIEKNSSFSQKNRIKRSNYSDLFNAILELIASEDSWIQSISDANICLLSETMQTCLLDENKEITQRVFQERSYNIEQFVKYQWIESHFTSGFFDVYEAVKQRADPKDLLSKILGDMQKMSEDKIQNIFVLSLIQPHIDYYRVIIESMDLKNISLELRNALNKLENLTTTPFQRITRYPMLLEEIEKNFNNYHDGDNSIKDLALCLKESITVAKERCQNLNETIGRYDKAHTENAISLIKTVITRTDWNIKRKKFARGHQEHCGPGIPPSMASMLMKIYAIEQSVAEAVEKMSEINSNVDSKLKVDRDNIRTEVVEKTLVTIQSIAKSAVDTEQNRFSLFSSKDDPKVTAFYHSIICNDNKFYRASELLSPFIEPSITIDQSNKHKV